MIIEDIKIEVQYIDLKNAFVTALRRVETIEFVRVFIVCSDDGVGIGEAPATKAITDEDIKSIVSSIEQMRVEMIGLKLKEALVFLHQTSFGSSAKAALDMALFSLISPFKVENRQQIKTDITISLNDKRQMLKDAKNALLCGRDILKIKLGSDIAHAISVTKLLAKELSSAKLLIDANQAWSLAESLEYIRAVEGLKIELIEQPVVAEDLESLKIITDISSIPILADEAVFTLEDVQKVMESKFADMINIKLMKCGGVSRAIKILEYARENKIVCMLGSMLEGPYSINAALYLAFNYRDVIKYVDLDSPLLYKEASEVLEFKFDGCTIWHKENLP